jgi:hypothetical protein
MANRKDWGQPQTGGQGFARTMKTVGRRVTISVADNVTGNTIGAFTVPPGFTVTGIIAVATDIDTGTAAVTLSVGDASSGNRYLSASTIGQAGTSTQTLATTGLLFKNLVDTEILITVTLQSAAAAAGTVDLYLQGFIDN